MRETRADSERISCQPPKAIFVTRKRGKPTRALSFEITPQDPVAVADEIGLPFRRRTDRRFEHRRKETRDEGEDRRIRPAGLFAQHKSFVSDKGGKGLDVGNRELSLLAWVWRQNPCNFSVFLTLRRIRRCTIGRNGIGTTLKNWAGPLAKLASSIQRDATKAQ